jgi:hypothetical protein
VFLKRVKSSFGHHGLFDPFPEVDSFDGLVKQLFLEALSLVLKDLFKLIVLFDEFLDLKLDNWIVYNVGIAQQKGVLLIDDLIVFHVNLKVRRSRPFKPLNIDQIIKLFF